MFSHRSTKFTAEDALFPSSSIDSKVTKDEKEVVLFLQIL